MLEFDNFKTFWQRRSKLEKRLILFVLLLLVVLIIFILHMIFSKGENCTTVDCVSAATHILDYIDPSVRPCDDFHQFVCGSFIKKAKEYNKATILKSMQEQTESRIEALITADPDDTSTHSLKLQRQFYRSCINTTSIEADENEHFLTLLDAMGGWPVIKSNFWDEKNFDWNMMMVKARKLGLSFQKFIGFHVTTNDENKIGLQILPPDDVDHISYEMMEPYVEVMRDIAILLHAPSLGISSELRHVVHFQNELHRIVTNSRTANIKPKQLRIHKWQQIFPRISWVQLINNVLSDVVSMKETDVLTIVSEQYLRDLEVLLLKTQKRVQANYIIWKTIEKFIPFLTEEVRKRYDKYQRQHTDQKTGRSRREVCIDLSKHMFTDVAEIEYVRQYADPDTRREITEIFEKVKEKLLRRLKTTSKLTVELDREMEEEMRNVTMHIGISDAFYDVTESEKHLGYNKLAFGNDDLVRMVTKTSINRIDHLFANIGKEKDDGDLDFVDRTLAAVNAFYIDAANLFVLPVPLLQDIFYNKKRPNYMNYGTLVSTIGHEYAHSLAKLGNKTYVEQGKHLIVYNQAFFEAFGESSRCFEEEYEHFHNETHSSEIPVNYNETLEENIADFIGTDIAYELYQDYVDEHGSELKLPGVDFTPNQIFWMMTGTFLCKKPEAGSEAVHHAAGVYRINYRLRNLPQFARDFHCPKGSFMNPEEKCSIF
ncbi:hypothetical protein HHI36_000305 [Cryptolaemus montrouzieri]|uniref:Uncharacterized protein n=1 Tax=Cryptolaemus montrouzieri TaxID=559131 RepID=A0ABD2P491_9CUCU